MMKRLRGKMKIQWGYERERQSPENQQCRVQKSERREDKVLRGWSMESKTLGELRRGRGLAIRKAPGCLQESSLERVIGTEAEHRDKIRKRMRRKAEAISSSVHPLGLSQAKGRR